MDLDATLNSAVAIAREAGALLLRGQDEIKLIDNKSSAVDLVTQYDRDSEQLIVNFLRHNFPDHFIIGEEGVSGDEFDTSSGYLWYVDPLDGTNNYAHGFPIWAVSIALYNGAHPILGVVYDPGRDELFTAIAGRGAYLQRGDHRRRLQVSSEPRLVGSLLATGFPYDRHTSPHNNIAQVEAFLKRALGIRRPGAAALDMAYVAAGRLDGYWELKVKSWDAAAALIMVAEAGGRATLTNGIPVSLGGQFDVLVTNRAIHDQMLAVLEQCTIG